ncbi:DUF3800 domain-containing protein [Paenibacillus sp. NFR01]|uniref:DUF3800 domain-containing protein n=1 Tax=Paenibacillus sp. NFR01 TaxID=1566279 RepID=UPI0008CC5E12|nr:DUF3800 domain-containing protein [Paenibacillus sp. NFR01]SEU32876.1 Protein of unknown function [Paenibacillus sp. NFR01]
MILNFDESGNLGKQGRYFTIACVAGENLKPLENIMNRSIVKVKSKFPKFTHRTEVKASDSNPIIKEYMLRKIASKNMQIKYIVADLEHVQPNLLDDENLLYNFMLKFLIVPLCKRRNLKELTINLDKRSIKVGSENSFEDYIKIKVNYECGFPVKINVNYIESQNSVLIQAADFVANAINTKYEYGYDYYYNLIKDRIEHVEHFPYKLFGSNKVVQFRQS